MKKFLTFGSPRAAIMRSIVHYVFYPGFFLILIIAITIGYYANKTGSSVMSFVLENQQKILLTMLVPTLIGFSYGANRKIRNNYMDKKLEKKTVDRNWLKGIRDSRIETFQDKFSSIKKHFEWGIGGKKMPNTPAEYFQKCCEIFTISDLFTVYELSYSKKDNKELQRLLSCAKETLDLNTFNQKSLTALSKLFDDLLHQWRVIFQREISEYDELIENLKARLKDS
jgi:hypothetical protein